MLHVTLTPCTLASAKRFVAEHHRHNLAPVGGLFAVGCSIDDELVGVGIAGRPVARMLDDGATVEITRICTLGETNACSMLYGALNRAAKALGYRRAITYTLSIEDGASVRAAGFALAAELPARSGWDVPSRRRVVVDLFGNDRTPPPEQMSLGTDAERVKAPFTYFGGKGGMARRIVALLPEHDIYVEPFAGSLAVLFAKPLSTHEIVNDVDGAITTFFRVLRERPDELADVCHLTPYSRREFEAALLTEIDLATLPELEVARRFWVRVSQSFGQTAGPVTGWSMTIGRTQSKAVGVQNRIARFLQCAERLSSVSIENRPALELITRLGRPNALIYLDPPYLGLVRSHESSSSVEYRHDMAHPDDHIALAKALHATPATVVLSGYPSDLYEDLFGDWWSMDFHVTAHSSNARTATRTGRIERLWSNRDLDNGRLPFEVTA